MANLIAMIPSLMQSIGTGVSSVASGIGKAASGVLPALTGGGGGISGMAMKNPVTGVVSPPAIRASTVPNQFMSGFAGTPFGETMGRTLFPNYMQTLSGKPTGIFQQLANLAGQAAGTEIGGTKEGGALTRMFGGGEESTMRKQQLEMLLRMLAERGYLDKLKPKSYSSYFSQPEEDWREKKGSE